MPARSLLVVVFAVGCGGSQVTPPPDPKVTTDTAIAPPPFTPDQLRAGLPVGTLIHYSVQPGDGGAHELVYEVTAADATSVTIRSTKIHGDGQREVSPVKPTLWKELAAHAHFPAERTRVYDVQAITYAGPLSTRAYEVTDPSGIVSTYYFALDMPGPPVLLETLDGRANVMKMSLIARRPSTPAP